MIKNFNVEATYKQIILDSKKKVLNPATGKFLVVEENISSTPKKTQEKTKVLIRRGGFENDKC